MFFKNSRYNSVTEYLAKDSNGNQNLVKKIRFTPNTDSSTYHRMIQSDRLDLLANQYYGNPTKFWLICDGNKEMYPDDLLENDKKIRISDDIF